MHSTAADFSQNTSQRIFGLDLLRAYAVFCVVYVHGYELISSLVPKKIYNLPTQDGVTIFFVLSGFLIGRILMTTIRTQEFTGKTLLEFWLRRWFRTLPAYFLILTTLNCIHFWKQAQLPEHLAQYYFFSQNLNHPHPRFFGEAWSLAVEEWFYLLLPVPLAMIFHVGGPLNASRRLLLTILSAIIFATSYRSLVALKMGYVDFSGWDEGLRKVVIYRMDALLYGVLGAYLSLYLPEVWHRARRPALCLGIALLLFDKLYYGLSQDMDYLNLFRLTITPIATLLLLPWLANFQPSDHHRFIVKSTGFVSNISYSMYLTNYSLVYGEILPWFQAATNGGSSHTTIGRFLDYLVFWTITVGLSYLIWRHFEKPMTALREHFSPARSPKGR